MIRIRKLLKKYFFVNLQKANKAYKNWNLYMGVFLVSLSILALETILNRMFALTFWYHFAFIILSVALFGIGVGGMLVFFINRFVKGRIPYVLAGCSVLLAFFVPYVLVQINTIPLEMNLVASSAVHQAHFRDFFLTLVIPFMLAGYIFSTIFTNFSHDIHKVYFFDLVGGGLGCFFALIVFPHNGPIVTSVVVSIVVLIAAFFFLVKKNFILSVIPLVLIFIDIFAVYPAFRNIDIRVSADKRQVEKFGDRIFTDWDNFGFVGIHDKSDNQKIVTVDYSCFTYLYKMQDLRTLMSIPSYMPMQSYPYVLKKKPGDVGIVGVGAGRDVMIALNHGAERVWGAEFNSTVYRIYNDLYSSFIGGVSKLSNVHIMFEEGRFFVRSSKRKYDVLIFDNSISQVAVSSGSFTLAESYLFTVEGLMDYIRHLKDGGILYLSNPIVDAPRFITVIREAFRRMGIEKEFRNSVFIAEQPGEYRRCKILVKKGGYSRAEAKQLVNFTYGLKYKTIYSPFSKYGTDEEKLVLSRNIRQDYITSDTDIRPSTDDWPFFSQHVKPESVSMSKGANEMGHFYPQPFLLLREITKQVGLYSLLFLLLPLVILNLGGLRKLPNKVGSIVYFSSLGMGFMLMEVVMMQKYTLILGHPVFSFSVVLSTLLVSSGIGSFITDKIKSPFQAIFYGLAGIVLTTVLSYLIVLFLGSHIVGLPIFLRSLIVVILVAITGFFMGFMMPAGIKAVSKHNGAIPWMWSVNGIFSVVASFIAINISVMYGYTAVFIAGLAVYLIGSLVFVGKFSMRK